MAKTFKEKINGIKYFVTADESLESMVRILLNGIRNIPPEKAMRDDFRLELLFSVYTFKKKLGGYQVMTQDFMGDALREKTEDLTVPLFLMMKQLLLVKQYQLEPASCRFDDKIILTKGALDNQYISLDRNGDAKPGESGWFIQGLRFENGVPRPILPAGFEGVDPLPAEAYESIYAWQLLQKRPSAAEALLLPYNYCAILNWDELQEILTDQNERLIGG